MESMPENNTLQIDPEQLKKQRCKEAQKRYYEKNREKIIDRNLRYYYKKKGYTPEKIESLVERKYKELEILKEYYNEDKKNQQPVPSPDLDSN